ncbi:Palmitoyltransferase ZDHHC15 [Smittium culicis]|nr:Palmitoyltransferase ZDHHC15 [Smittium culicis]
MSTAVFMGVHLLLAATNTTTVENFINRANPQDNSQQDPNPYNLGYMKNLEQVFGNKWYYWLLPIETT